MMHHQPIAFAIRAATPAMIVLSLLTGQLFGGGCSTPIPERDARDDASAGAQAIYPPPPVVAPISAPIDEFQGDYRFLSNFWPAPVTFDEIEYPSVEHAYQAAKTLDPDERRRIAALATPAEAKTAGRALASRGLQRADWEQVKVDVMEQCVREKFTRHADLRAKLLATGDAELIEGNDWGDRVWGVSPPPSRGGVGENRLGKILMSVRDELRGRATNGQGRGVDR